MSIRFRIQTDWFLLLFAASLFLHANPGHAAVGVTISPSVITNDFAGKIVISVTGLASGKTIRVEKFADLNTNGVIDPKEVPSLWRSFTVMDGQLPLLGGCTNLNVAGDMDGAVNGQIRAELLFPGVDASLDRLGLKYLIRVSDPAGLLPPITNSFEVRQKIYPQGSRVSLRCRQCFICAYRPQAGALPLRI